MARRLLNNIRRLRMMNQPRLSQRALARVLGVCPQTLSEWETGEAVPTLMSALKIAEALGVDVASLFPEHTEAARAAITAAGVSEVTIRRPLPERGAPWSSEA